MDIFTTRIKLKPNVARKDIWNLIQKWLLKSPHYNINEINYNENDEYFSQEFNNSKLTVLSLNIEKDAILGVRFENKEDNVIWYTDYIYVENTENRYINIKLSCYAKEYLSSLPKYHKPHFIKLLFDEGFCKDDGIFPITDYPIELNDYFFTSCVKMIQGKLNTDLPVVFLSYDLFSQNHYSADPQKLAIELAGVAHVLIEPNKDFGYRLKEATNNNNVYNGYIGIYFPMTNYRETVSTAFYDKDYSGEVCETVRQAILNHSNIEDLSWSKLFVEYNKQHLSKQSERRFESELNDYINSFDADNKELKETVAMLRKQLDDKTAQIESLKKRATTGLTLSCKSLTEFYIDEFKDLLLTVLQAVLTNISEKSRAYEIITSIINENEITGNGKIIFERIKKALQNENLAKRNSELEACGFTVEKGAHDKIIFHDKRYCFTLANTPSDNRTIKNSISDILKIIDIYRKPI